MIFTCRRDDDTYPELKTIDGISIIEIGGENELILRERPDPPCPNRLGTLLLPMKLDYQSRDTIQNHLHRLDLSLHNNLFH